MNNTKRKRLCAALMLSLLLVCVMGTTAFAAGTGDVAGAVESTWQTASGQIKTVVNNVVFPAIDLILAVFFFAKVRVDGARHSVRVPRVHADSTAVHLADHRNLRCRR
mgnify:CR=1 FL=1